MKVLLFYYGISSWKIKKIYSYLLDTNFEQNIDKIKEILFKNINQEYIDTEKDKTLDEKKKDLQTIIKSIKNPFIKNRIQTLKRKINSETNNKDTILKDIEKLSSQYMVD